MSYNLICKADLDVEFLMEENKKKFIDFNIDLAQSSDSEDKSFEMIDDVSSVNIACGLHSGNPVSMKHAVEHCKFKSKVLGALIGFPGTSNNPSDMTEEEIEAIVLYQLGAISAFAKAYSLNIEHVRPHGAMYELLKDNKDFALKLINSIKKFNKWFILYGPVSEIFKQAAKELNMNIAQELIIENDDSVEKLKGLIAENNCPDTLHFHCISSDAKELVEKAMDFAQARPVNFNNVVSSGWVD